MTTSNAEIVQAARNLHHAIRDTFFGEAQDIFDNAAAFDPGDRVLDDDTRTGEDRVDELLPDTQLFAFGVAWSGFLPAHNPETPCLYGVHLRVPNCLRRSLGCATTLC